MGECLLIARKGQTKTNVATFIILDERPAFPLLGSSAAREIHQLIASKNVRTLQDGPFGGTPLHFGDDVIGQAVQAALPVSGGWKLSRIADIALAQTAYQIANQKLLWLPSMSKSQAVHIPMTTVAAIGKIGPYHADINGLTSTGGIRGPFTIEDVKPNSAPTYPVIWSHDAKNQRSMSFDGESQGLPRKGSTPAEQAFIDQKVANIWASASHCHFNRDFRFNSQCTGMQFTPRRTIGGRAWISIKLSSPEQEKALVLWANTSLGSLLHWYNANKQQSGRGSVGVLALQDLPILDVTALTPKQLSQAVKLFDEMSRMDLLPLYQVDIDPARQALDEKFARDVLGLPVTMLAPGGPLELLRRKLAREPSIRGQKNAAGSLEV